MLCAQCENRPIIKRSALCDYCTLFAEEFKPAWMTEEERVLLVGDEMRIIMDFNWRQTATESRAAISRKYPPKRSYTPIDAHD